MVQGGPHIESVAPRRVQAQLHVGPVDDTHERDADAVADQVVQRLPMSGAAPAGISNGAAGIQRKCAACEHEEEGQVQRKPLIQAKGSQTSGIAAPRGFGQQMGRSQGMPLDRNIRRQMEGGFGRDFGGVRIHTGEQAARLSGQIGARAFTHGQDIFFNRGEYQPGTRQGQHLLAHELTHTVQQGADGRGLQRTPGVDAQDSWNALVDYSVKTSNPQYRTRADEAVRRFLQTAAAQELINWLYNKACTGKDAAACKGQLLVKFRDQADYVKEAACYFTMSDGCFMPGPGGKWPFEVFVKNADITTPETNPRNKPDEPAQGPPDERREVKVHKDDESEMAQTLFHEMLHVKFVTDGQKHEYRTGHGSVFMGEMDKEFAAQLNKMSQQLKALEDKAAEEKRKADAAKPSPVGGRVQVGHTFGGMGGHGFQANAMVGADLVFKTAVDLGIGVRGVFISPDNLLIGPTGSIRIGGLGKGWFVDVEAGALFPLPTEAKDSVATTVMGMGAAGIGQQYTVKGGMVFWKVGGMFLVSDKFSQQTGGGIGGGVAGGTGVAF